MTSEIGPDYRHVMSLIRSRVTAGDWQVGQKIPSTTELQTLSGLSITSVRRAVQQLQTDGILKGHPGKGVFVRATPADADSERMTVEMLGKQVAELREMAERDGLDEIRSAVGRLEANLIDLYGRLGFDYPSGGSSDTPRKAAAGRGRPGR